MDFFDWLTVLFWFVTALYVMFDGAGTFASPCGAGDRDHRLSDSAADFQ